MDLNKYFAIKEKNEEIRQKELAAIEQVAVIGANPHALTYEFESGDGLTDHTHDYSHDCVLASGAVIIKVEGENDLILSKIGDRAILPPNKIHSIKALLDKTKFINTRLRDNIEGK